MPRFIEYDYNQTVLLPVAFENQILPGTFEHSIHYLVDHQLDLSIFDSKYKNDDSGRPAYDPAILLKIVLLAYARGVTSSRRIARLCEENVVFMAISADSRPHFTTIADFISGSTEQIAALFRQVLLICDQMGLIGKEMFAIDGCKLPSNAAKEWSGTRADFQQKVAKMEQAIRQMVFDDLGKWPEEIFAAENVAGWNDRIEFFSRTREADNRRKGLVEIEI